MQGNATLGGVDAVPICLGTKDADELSRTVALLEPSFGDATDALIDGQPIDAQPPHGAA